MARKKQPPISDDDRQTIGALLRDLRRSCGYRSVESVADMDACPASRQTIYAYERGGLVPSLPQFLELVEFYVLEAPRAPGALGDADIRARGVAAVTHALMLPAYHMVDAMRLMGRMQPDRRKRSARSA